MAPPSLKAFFAAGLAMEEAREVKAAARDEYRKAVAERCPSELAALEAASKAALEAEKAFLALCAVAENEHRDQAVAAMRAHVAECKDPSCEIRTALAQHDQEVN